MPKNYSYWRTDGNYYPGVPGIRVVVGDTNYMDIEWIDQQNYIDHGGYPAGFAAYARRCLNYLYATATGTTVLNFLAGLGTIEVSYSRTGNSAAAHSLQGSMNQVAYELVVGGAPGNATKKALSTLSNNVASYKLLAHLVNEQPTWDLSQRPGSTGGFWALGQAFVDFLHASVLKDTSSPTYLFEDNSGGWSRDTGKPVDVGPSGLGVTGSEMFSWLESGTLPARLSVAQQRQLKMAAIVALEPYSDTGAGCGSTIGFATDPLSTMNRMRPPAIGLGHELVHAYFSAKGEQPGREGPAHWSTVLFEFKCVGIGPWDEKPISENGFRSGWAGAVSGLVGVDVANQHKPAKRVKY